MKTKKKSGLLKKKCVSFTLSVQEGQSVDLFYFPSLACPATQPVTTGSQKEKQIKERWRLGVRVRVRVEAQVMYIIGL